MNPESCKRLIDLGVTGLTSNPTIFQKAIAESSDYDEALETLAAGGSTVDEIYESLTVEDIRAAADLLRPVYDETDAADGYASLEVSPHLANDTGGTIDEARRLFGLLDRPERDGEGAGHSRGHSRRTQADRGGH